MSIDGAVRKLRVALVGAGFGADFAPIYSAHPDVEWVGICDPDAEKLALVCERFKIEHRWTSLDEVLSDGSVDAVHLATSIPLHAQQSIAMLDAGRHCACAVPMATNFEEIQAIIRAQRRSGKNYMMMETVVYTREFLMVQDLFDGGEFGNVSFARGCHMQDMDGWPEYWQGLPPHHYMTHAISPVLRLLKTSARKKFIVSGPVGFLKVNVIVTATLFQWKRRSSALQIVTWPWRSRERFLRRCAVILRRFQ